MSWPHDISIDAFRNRWILEGEPLWESVFEMHKGKMQIKNAKVAIPNLEKIQSILKHVIKKQLSLLIVADV